MGNITTDFDTGKSTHYDVIKHHDALTPEVAAAFDRSQQTILRWAAAGTIPSIRVGHEFRYNVNDVARALLQANE